MELKDDVKTAVDAAAEKFITDIMGENPLGEDGKIHVSITGLGDEDLEAGLEESLEDALQDMMNEDITPVFPIYIASYVVFDEEGDFEQGVLKILADTFEEANGSAYLELIDEYPGCDGYMPPHIVVCPSPIFMEIEDNDDCLEDDDLDLPEEEEDDQPNPHESSDWPI